MSQTLLETPTGLGAVVRRLCAPAPAWEHSVDVVIVGSGVAGLGLASELSGSGLRTAVVTKARLCEGSTTWAQGGVATAMSSDDSPEAHFRDTITAGAGLCDEDAVRILVTEGPAAVRAIRRAGARFDSDDDGRLAFTREGGHSRARIVHAGGDATGRELQRTLESIVAAVDDVTLLENTFALDVLRDDEGGAAGLLVARLATSGECRDIGVLRARAVVIASGGIGQVYASTTNPPVATGDGIGLAFRAGAEIIDLEFVQFHPTALWRPGKAAGRQLLISEAVRGEGAVLVDANGARVMAGLHPLADLAPRDVVSAAMAERMAFAPGGVRDHLYLDARGIGEDRLLRRFPTIVAACRKAGIDPVTDVIPVAPAAHYSCGGVRADMNGRTTVPALYAVGEAACTGVHGANRLASNSLLEGLVVARRLAQSLRGNLPPRRNAAIPDQPDALIDADARSCIATEMARDVGIRRSPEGLAVTARTLADAHFSAEPRLAAWEATNIHTVASLIVAAATARTESRGCHRRTDFTDPRDEWRCNIAFSMESGQVRQEILR